jgi:hypothetical protein
MRENDEPKVMTRCLSVKYIPAERKAGARVKRTIWSLKPESL